MEEILEGIIEAENQAEEIKNSARLRAAKIIEDSEKRALDAEKRSVEECKILKEKKIAEAEVSAQSAYDKELAEKQAEAKAYADKMIKKAEPFADKIVGRIVRGIS